MSEPFGPDVQWFDHSKTENWERFRATVAALSAAQARLKEWEIKAANWMASPEALARLEGYRELGAQVAQAENDRDALKTQITSLKADFETVEKMRQDTAQRLEECAQQHQQAEADVRRLMDELRATQDSYAAQIAYTKRLREALEQFGMHGVNCTFRGKQERCDCGLHAALGKR